MDTTKVEELVRRMRLIADLVDPGKALDRDDRGELSGVLCDLVDDLTTTLFGKDYNQP